MAHFSQSLVSKFGLSVSASEDSVTNATYYPLFGTQSVGVLTIKASSTKLSFNPASGLLRATALAGNGAQLTNLDISQVATGILPVTRGGTGTGTSTGTGSVVLQSGAVLSAPTINNAQATNLNVTGTCGLPPNTYVDGPARINGSIELGSITVAAGAYIDFHSSGTVNDFDGRIVASGGNVNTGNARMDYTGTAGHYFSGSITSNGDITAFSDARLKNVVGPITGALARVRKWVGVVYTLKTTGERKRGFIAQNIHDNGGEDYVKRDPETGYLSLAYQNLTADHNEAIKELDDNVRANAEEAMTAIKELREELATLKARVKELEAR